VHCSRGGDCGCVEGRPATMAPSGPLFEAGRVGSSGGKPPRMGACTQMRCTTGPRGYHRSPHLRSSAAPRSRRHPTSQRSAAGGTASGPDHGRYHSHSPRAEKPRPGREEVASEPHGGTVLTSSSRSQLQVVSASGLASSPPWQCGEAPLHVLLGEIASGAVVIAVRLRAG
jgi:hypothetical protein